MEVVRVKHSINSGDAIASMPGLKYIYDQIGKKTVLYQRLNMPADYTGQTHPIKSDTDEKVQVCMNKKQWSLLSPLIESQPYIDHCEVWEGHPVDLDFDKIREGQVTTMPFGSINRWLFYQFPTIACDLSIPWIDVPIDARLEAMVSGKMVVNLTERYRNPLITYYFLKKWEDRIIFTGTKKEYDLFCSENKLLVPYLEVENFLQLAQALKSCKLFVGNQSMAWNICEAMKTLRVLEVCRQASNCIPIGANGYDFLQQGALEIYVNKFMR